MVKAIVCREMKWDYHTYMQQPQHFITIVLAMLQAESAEHARRTQSH